MLPRSDDPRIKTAPSPGRNPCRCRNSSGHYPMLEKPDKFNRSFWDVLKEFATKN
jgi:hypothetical protein